MALALLFPDSSVMYLDAVVNYGRTASSTIASNPLDNLVNITDHVAKNNLSISIQGVVSSADFQEEYTRSFDLLGEYGTRITTNYNSSVSEASITDSGDLLGRILDNSLLSGIFGKQHGSTVEMDPFRGYSHEIARDRLNKAWDQVEEITLLDYNYDNYSGRTVSIRSYEHCFIENLEDTEDAQTGDAFEFRLTLKQVRFATVQKTNVKATGKKKKHKGTVTKTTTGSNTAVSNEKRKNSWESTYKPKIDSLSIKDL